MNNSLFSVYVTLVFGLVGYAMKRLSLPVAPLVLGLVIGPLFEKSLTQSSALAGDEGVAGLVLASPTAIGVLLVAALLVVGPVLGRAFRTRTAGAPGGADDDPEAASVTTGPESANVDSAETGRTGPDDPEKR